MNAGKLWTRRRKDRPESPFLTDYAPTRVSVIPRSLATCASLLPKADGLREQTTRSGLCVRKPHTYGNQYLERFIVLVSFGPVGRALEDSERHSSPALSGHPNQDSGH